MFVYALGNIELPPRGSGIDGPGAETRVDGAEGENRCALSGASDSVFGHGTRWLSLGVANAVDDVDDRRGQRNISLRANAAARAGLSRDLGRAHGHVSADGDRERVARGDEWSVSDLERRIAHCTKLGADARGGADSYRSDNGGGGSACRCTRAGRGCGAVDCTAG